MNRGRAMDISRFRKKLLSACFVFALITAGFIGLLVFEGGVDERGAQAKTIIVDKAGGGNYTSIKAAIAAANAGDTIYVWAGTYKEKLIINKKLTLIGNGTTNTTINGGGSGNVVRITADWVKVGKFKIENAGDSGIKLDNVKNCKIFNNTCTSNKYGISASSSKRNTIENNTCNSSDWRGILIYFSSDSNIIANNTCLNSEEGIHIRFSSGNLVINNTCKSNSVYGIYLDSATNNNTIANNTCANGIRLSSSSRNTIIGNNFFNNIITVYPWSHYNKIVSNICSTIDLSQSNNNTIADNYRLKKGIYIKLLMSSGNILANNTCEKKFQEAIILSSSNNNTLTNNICSNSTYGIRLVSSSGNKLINNTCSNNSRGINLEYSSDNKLTNNTCLNNSRYIYIDHSSRITLSDNQMSEFGLVIKGDSLTHWNTHSIDISNTLNGKPVYYWKNRNGGVIPSNPGQVILANCKYCLPLV